MNAVRLLFAAATAGVVAVLLYCSQAEGLYSVLLNVATLLTLSGAAFAVSALVGFLFGIPRSLQASPVESASSKDDPASRPFRAGYLPNTNLEQISDWLTKILVGVGLTKLESLSREVGHLADWLTQLMPTLSHVAIFGPSLAIYYAVMGFMAGYLWTRLKLAEQLAVSDRRSEEARLRTIVSAAAATAQTTGGSIDQAAARRIVGLAADLTPSVLTAAARSTLLWVDDEPEGNVHIRRSLESLDIEVILATSTTEGLAIASSRPIAAVITDMGRPPDERAGYTLVDALREADNSVPVFIYSRSGSLPQNREEAKRRGANGSTNDPNELLHWVLRAISEGDRRV